jgi:hypothetical protein
MILKQNSLIDIIKTFTVETNNKETVHIYNEKTAFVQTIILANQVPTKE